MSPRTRSGRELRGLCAPLQRTEGQPPPIAANGGLSYMSFDREGDAGTAAAIQDALAEIAEGEGQRVIEMIDKAPPGPIKTKWVSGSATMTSVSSTFASRTASRATRRRGATAVVYRLRAADLFRGTV